ncbi:coadhesin-like isoform X2 [Dreissena polymorpha]|uniref:ShKT domain-containing protein n=1 Tax=Dreissena polymorpha TaxID=45954 RepID=A0A9D4HHP4_DREPO|nr:coadhesin-like isoform X2 [Dreissena polymorpha]KAH3719495.1 hypothetical protein DPMN_062332 [Dreissena polymorpha]
MFMLHVAWAFVTASVFVVCVNAVIMSPCAAGGIRGIKRLVTTNQTHTQRQRVLTTETGRLGRFLLDDYHWSPWSPDSPCDCSTNIQYLSRSCLDGQGHFVPNNFCGDNYQQKMTCICNGPSPHMPHACVDQLPSCFAILCATVPGYAEQYCASTCGHCQSSTQSTPGVHSNDLWSTWTGFTACSVTCGQGYKQRYRRCMTGSGSCYGSSTENQMCDMGQCHVDGHWGPWSPFTSCSHSCGTGMKIRSRTCSYPIPSAPGAPCPGDSYDRQACNVQSCIIDGQWSTWTDWSRCSVTCGLGTISRDRTCTAPAPSNGGQDCSGEKTQRHDCADGACAEWGHWFDGSCSVSCGEGIRERLRHCSTGRDIDCPGTAQVTVNCTALICV